MSARMTSSLLALLLLAMPAKADPAPPPVGGVPLPADLRLPSTGDRFGGAWAGTWGAERRQVLVVEAVEADGRATVVYGVSALPAQRMGAGWWRLPGRIEGEELVVEGGRFTLRYRPAEPDRLDATWTNQAGAKASGLVRRIDPARLASLPPAPGPAVAPEILMLPVTVAQGRETVRLETILYRPAGPGPHPLAVVSHGSTGTGRDAARFGRSWTAPALARILLERGYVVAFPQRRGRGRSEGLYDEGFAPDRTLGYSCEPEISLAGAERALEDLDAAITALAGQPGLDARQVLLLGQSRGGILSIAYAGRHPERVAGVVNFVGGWMGEGCATAARINQALARDGARFGRPTLWLYGQADAYYSMAHSRANAAAYRDAGGDARFEEREVPQDGHALVFHPALWAEALDRYLAGLPRTP